MHYMWQCTYISYEFKWIHKKWLPFSSFFWASLHPYPIIVCSVTGYLDRSDWLTRLWSTTGNVHSGSYLKTKWNTYYCYQMTYIWNMCSFLHIIQYNPTQMNRNQYNLFDWDSNGSWSITVTLYTLTYIFRFRLLNVILNTI